MIKYLEEQILSIKKEVMEHTQEFIELTVKNINYKIPKEPFIGWALNRTNGMHLAPEWKPCSPSGLKMHNDCVYHSDWMIGAGIPLELYDDKLFTEASYNLMFKIQEDLLNFKSTVLCGKGEVQGFVYQPDKDETIEKGLIIVIPTASMEYFIPMQNAAGVITQTGGRLCHLAVEANVLNICMLLVPDALIRYPDRCRVSLNCDKGLVKINNYSSDFYE